MIAGRGFAALHWNGHGSLPPPTPLRGTAAAGPWYRIPMADDPREQSLRFFFISRAPVFPPPFPLFLSHGAVRKEEGSGMLAMKHNTDFP